jgi:3-methyladenine DNA glycosylase AlkC
VTTGRVLLKDQLFNRDKVTTVATRIACVHPAFARQRFIDEVMDRLGELELKQRIGWITQCLERHLPADYRPAVDVLLRSLPAPCDPARSDGDFGDFIYAPYSEYIARRGSAPADRDFSLAALKQITTRFSAEDAIRTFINANPTHTLRTLTAWTRDEHYHVRRLCSEGTRPRLPWARRLSIPTTAALPILDRLSADPTRFVTRSVANHLNDIAKTDPDLVVETLQRWRRSGRQTPREMDYIVRHATRSLVKAGHPATLAILGIPTSRTDVVARLRVPRQVQLDTALEFSLDLESGQETEVIVDYVLHFPGPAGKLTGRKVYKLRRVTLSAGVTTITKRHRLRSGMTTRTLYPGRHEIEVLVNGTPKARGTFWLNGSEAEEDTTNHD